MAKYSSFPMDITVMGMTALSNISQRELLSRGAAAGFPSSAKTLQAPIKFWWPHSLCCHHTASLVGHMTSNCPELKMLFNDCIIYAPDSHIIWVRLGSFHGNKTWHQEIKHKTDLKRGSQAVAHWQSGGTPALVTEMREENRDKIIPYEMVSSCHISELLHWWRAAGQQQHNLYHCISSSSRHITGNGGSTAQSSAAVSGDSQPSYVRFKHLRNKLWCADANARISNFHMTNTVLHGTQGRLSDALLTA